MRQLLWPLLSLLALMIAAALPANAQVAFEPEMEEAGPTTRIVGGQEARPGSWPAQTYLFIVYLDKDGKARAGSCGGTVIAPLYVLTAAHCIVDKNGQLPKVQMVLAVENLNNLARAKIWIDQNLVPLAKDYKDYVTGQKSLPREVRLAASLIPHPEYSPTTKAADLAILRFTRPSEVPQRATLASAAMAPTLTRPGVVGTVVGWGTTSEGGETSNALRQVKLSIFSREECGQIYNQGSNRIDSRHVCAGTRSGGKDSCQGDSGGPLFVDSANRNRAPVQIGVVSYGLGCGRAGVPGVYTSVGHYESWLRKIVPDAVFVPKPPPANSGFATTDAALTPPPRPAPPPQAAAADPRLWVNVNPPRPKVGTPIRIAINTDGEGEIVVFNENANREIKMFFPNKYMAITGGRRDISIKPGQTKQIPDRMDDFELEVDLPAGENRIFALLLPRGTQLEDIVRSYGDIQPIPNPIELIAEMARRAVGDGRLKLVKGEMFYEIVP